LFALILCTNQQTTQLKDQLWVECRDNNE